MPQEEPHRFAAAIGNNVEMHIMCLVCRDVAEVEYVGRNRGFPAFRLTCPTCNRSTQVTLYNQNGGFPSKALDSQPSAYDELTSLDNLGQPFGKVC